MWEPPNRMGARIRADGPGGDDNRLQARVQLPAHVNGVEIALAPHLGAGRDARWRPVVCFKYRKITLVGFAGLTSAPD